MGFIRNRRDLDSDGQMERWVYWRTFHFWYNIPPAPYWGNYGRFTRGQSG